jgi:hypothetical protein
MRIARAVVAVMVGALLVTATAAARADAEVRGDEPGCEFGAGTRCVALEPRSGPPGTEVRFEVQGSFCEPEGGTFSYWSNVRSDQRGEFELIGEARVIGAVGADDVFTGTFTVPEDAISPWFILECADDQGHAASSFSLRADVPGGAGGGGTGSGSVPQGIPLFDVPHERSSVTRSVPTPGDVSTDGGLVLTNLVLALLMLLLVFPAELFNATLEEHYDEVTRWLRGPRSVLERVTSSLSGRGRWFGFVVVTAATAVLYAFLDPDAGFDTATIAFVLGVTGAIAAAVLIAAWAARRYAADHGGADGSLRVYPAALLVALVCVVISRLADFQPGYLYGIVAGFVFVAELSRAHDGRAAAFAAVVGLVASVAAWFAWVPVRDAVDGADPNAAALVLDALLATMFVGGLQALVFGFVPIRFLPGAKVWAWSKPAWAALFGIGAFGFLHILLHPTEDYEGSVTTMVVLFAGFALASGAFWAYFRFRTVPTREDEVLADA